MSTTAIPLKKWLMQYSIAWPLLVMLLAAVQYAKGHPLADALQFGALWAVISIGIFAARRYYNFHKQIACAICNDLPRGKARDPQP